MSFRNNSGYSSQNKRRSWSSSPSRYGRSGGGNGRRGGNRRGQESIDASKYIKKAEVGAEVIVHIPEWNYEQLKVSKQLKDNILYKKYNHPTPIQEKAIPYILEGKDFLGLANTGTGKTAAFLIPLLEMVIKDRAKKILIVVPTRELATQINDELYELSRGLKIYSVQCIGGASINAQISNLRRGFNFIVGTPGRLNDLIERKQLNLNSFATVVLDEVDRMLDMGFVDEIKWLIGQLPESRQSLFFSATLNNKVEKIMELLLKKDFIKVSVVRSETAKNVDQDVIKVKNRDDKIDTLIELLKGEGFIKVLVFAATKREVDKLEKTLRNEGFRTEAIHGDKRQNARQRAITNFKTGACKVLIATDVAARGLDIANVSHVINYDEPNTYADYIHRIGRTGRADKSGVALTFVVEHKF